ncbi:MAG: sulfotransferase domain-containing protein [Alphaproteobacteria bacterium]|nr:sulfotransferase domain-containing protein [Alphaproteobacteria bacterium]
MLLLVTVIKRRKAQLAHVAVSSNQSVECAIVRELFRGSLGIESEPKALDEAVEAARFQNMKKIEMATGLPGHNYDRNDTESRRMRRGLVGGFRDYLTPEQVKLINAACSHHLNPEAKEILNQTTWLACPQFHGHTV